MLAPLIVAAIENGGAFRAVVLTPSVAAGDRRLDTEIMRLEQNFVDQPSRVRFMLRAYVVDDATRRVIAWREFDETVAATSEDPHGGVIAANRAQHYKDCPAEATSISRVSSRDSDCGTTRRHLIVGTIQAVIVTLCLSLQLIAIRATEDRAAP
jgi:hypothetical protein